MSAASQKSSRRLPIHHTRDDAEAASRGPILQNPASTRRSHEVLSPGIVGGQSLTPHTRAVTTNCW